MVVAEFESNASALSMYPPIDLVTGDYDVAQAFNR